MTRLFVLTFHGPKRWTEDIEHPHESPAIMTIPLILLAVGSIGAGCLMATVVPDWLTPVFGAEHVEHAGGASRTLLITILSLLVTVLGAGLAWALFRNGTAEQRAAGRACWSPRPAATSTPTPSTRRSSSSPAST